jgi:hypothetical protein
MVVELPYVRVPELGYTLRKPGIELIFHIKMPEEVLLILNTRLSDDSKFREEVEQFRVGDPKFG